MMEEPKIEVNLIDCTGYHCMKRSFAERKLVYTKSTRLEQGKETRQKIMEMTDEELKEELKYMANTIPSSWEFVNYTFEIRNVTRAFTHQFVRTRTGSYAQQTMRMLDKKEFTYRVPPKLRENEAALEIYHAEMSRIQESYDEMIEYGAAVEDARGVLPTNIHTNIIAQFNLRTVAEMARSRTGTRTQDEYREVLDMMLDSVLEVHPWAAPFLFPEKMAHIKKLESFIMEAAKEDNERMYDLLKSLDKWRKGEL